MTEITAPILLDSTGRDIKNAILAVAQALVNNELMIDGLSFSATGDKVTIKITQLNGNQKSTSLTAATTTKAGVMSAADKTKLNGLPTSEQIADMVEAEADARREQCGRIIENVGDLQDRCADIEGTIGDASTLTTTDKTSLVAAINELKGLIDNIQPSVSGVTYSGLANEQEQMIVVALNNLNSRITEIENQLNGGE